MAKVPAVPTLLRYATAKPVPLGVILFTIMTGGCPPYLSLDDKYFNIIQKGPALVRRMILNWHIPIISDAALELACSMLVADPKKRITWEGIRNHPVWDDSAASRDNYLNTFLAASDV